VPREHAAARLVRSTARAFSLLLISPDIQKARPASPASKLKVIR
jgi:hypothetical protein